MISAPFSCETTDWIPSVSAEVQGLTWNDLPEEKAQIVKTVLNEYNIEQRDVDNYKASCMDHETRAQSPSTRV